MRYRALTECQLCLEIQISLSLPPRWYLSTCCCREVRKEQSRGWHFSLLVPLAALSHMHTLWVQFNTPGSFQLSSYPQTKTCPAEIPLLLHSTGHVLSTDWRVYRPCGKELKVFAAKGEENRFQKQNWRRKLLCTLPPCEDILLEVTFSTTW